MPYSVIPDYTPITIGVSRPELALLAYLRGGNPSLADSVAHARDHFNRIALGLAPMDVDDPDKVNNDLDDLWEFILAIEIQPRSFDAALDHLRSGSILEMPRQYLPSFMRQ